MVATRRIWRGSLHQTFRLLPQSTPSLKMFLDSDGRSPTEVLGLLPYESARSQSGADSPDPKRYRDPKAVYQTVGLLFEDGNGAVRVTDLGHATRRWMPDLALANIRVLGRHAAYALAACQLRNPTGSGHGYESDVVTFPFAYIWRAMLALDDRISSEELNRAIFYAIDRASLSDAIDRIAAHRRAPSADALQSEVIAGDRKNDRIVPWISLASFGYTLIADKRETGTEYYQIRPEARQILHEASQIEHQHKEFDSTTSYVQHISRSGCLPKDVR